MRVTHLCLGCFFPDGYSYQENMLPKYHKQLGHDVNVIASLQTYDKDGHLTYVKKATSYINEHGVSVRRLEYKKPISVFKKLKRYVGTYEALEKADPEVLFIHGSQFMDVDVVVKYKKRHPELKIYVDNHADFRNSGKGFLSKNLMHKIVWRYMAHKLLPYSEKFYGVLPARVDFLRDVYKIPRENIELLCIGADDEFVEKYSSIDGRNRTRSKLGYSDGDKVIITGGKINANRPEVINLMHAIAECEENNIKLLVFGVVDSAFKTEFDQLLKNVKIKYIGWLSPEQTYEYIAASDLVVFPGLHSVMWEQAVAQGIPCAFRAIPGFSHVDIGGNAVFLDDVSVEGMKTVVIGLLGNHNKYREMLTAAQSEKRNRFLYSQIAEKSIAMNRTDVR